MTRYPPPPEQELNFGKPDPVSLKQAVDRDFLEKTWFILPCNDGEAKRSCQILKALEAPRLHISQQGWGAVLDREMGELDWNQAAGASQVVIFEIPGKSVNGEIPAEREFTRRGLQLLIIDHHYYRWVDRYHPESSLEQLCFHLGWQLSLTDQAIAVNDRSYIPGLKSMGLSREQILKVREFDYLAQGLTKSHILEQQKRAPEAVAGLMKHKKGRLWIVEDAGAERNFLLQEISLNSPDGLADLLEIGRGKLSFSGNPAVVDHLLGLNYKKMGFRSDYVCYGGGDQRYSKFWGFRPRLHDRITSSFIETILLEISRFIDSD